MTSDRHQSSSDPFEEGKMHNPKKLICKNLSIQESKLGKKEKGRQVLKKII